MTYVHIVRFVGVMWMSVHKETGPLFKMTRHPPQSFVKSIVRSGITSQTGVLGLKVDRTPSRSDSAFPAQACTRGSLETKNSWMQPGKHRSIAGGQSTILVSCMILQGSFDF